MCKIRIIAIILFMGSSMYGQTSIKTRKYVDSLVSLNPGLDHYKTLNYCQKINFIDSIVCNNSKNIFYEHYLRLIILDISTYTHVESNTRKSDFGPIYNDKKDYYKVERKWKKKLKCESHKMENCIK